MNTRDRRLTPTNASLIAGWDEAIHREGMELKADTASAFYLDGEGTSGDKEKSESKDTVRLITNNISKIQKNLNHPNINSNTKIKISKKNNYRVPVQYPDGKPGMPTSNKKANKMLKEGKAEIIKNKLNVFAIKLKFWPIYRELQPIVLLIDPGSTFTGIAVMSKRCINISYMLELPGYKKDSKPFTIINKHGKKIQKYHNTIVDRMTDRRRLRRSRRHRNCRRRECRFLNRSKKGKIAPSMLAKKQLELEMVKQLSKLYPIQIIGFEDVSFNHWGDKDGTKGQFFSQVEIGKNWLLERLKKIPNIIEIKIIKGYETNNRRKLLKLPKEEDKTIRSKKSHVTDCIAMGSIILNILDYPKNKFHFDIISRPKYSRRNLFAEQPGKGGIFERYGGHIPNLPVFKGLRKGDYVEATAPVEKKIYRGWISGYTGDRIYTSDFDWNQSQSFSVENVRLLDRNHGLLNGRLSYIEDMIDICQFGSKQIDTENKIINSKDINRIIETKKKAVKDAIKESNKQDKTIQQGIDGNMIKVKKETKIEKIPLDNSVQRGIDDVW